MPRRPCPPIIRPRVKSRPVEPRRPRGDAVNEKFQSGTLVVGKIMNQEHAEKRVLEIWDDMNKEPFPEAAS
jgi:hypothetical protein